MITGYIFDWDGTLVDTLTLTYEIYKKLFSDIGKKKLEFRDFKRLFSRNHIPLYEFMGLNKKEWADIDKKWTSLYLEKQNKIKLFPYAKKALLNLKAKGAKVALVSSGKGWRVNQELAILGVKDLFDAVITVELIPKPKPAPDSLLIAAEKIGVLPSECIYIGDMKEDVLAGKKASMKTAIVTHGMHGMRELLQLRPDFIFTDLRHLGEWNFDVRTCTQKSRY